jgi:hypothetical protein
MAGKVLVATVAWSIRSLGLQRKSLNWFVQCAGLIFVPRLNTFPRYKWDSTSGGIVIVGPAFITENMRSVNGCSMKTEANLAAVKAIPPGKIMFETGRFAPDPRDQITL